MTNRGFEAWISPLVAVAALAVVVTQTLAALRVTGAFGLGEHYARVVVPLAYQNVDQALTRRSAAPRPEGVRDPFLFVRSQLATAAALRPRPQPVLQPLEPDPVLTAIVWDDDPRALVRWRDREWTVREGGLFDEFRVVSITRDQIRLQRGEATLVLTRRNLGD